MKKRKGFTLIELMVVVLIVAVLAAVLVPMLTKRLEAARWPEGKAGAGTLATAIRAYAAEQDITSGDLTATVTDYLTVNDLKGKYFDESCYKITTGPTLSDTGALSYVITVTAPEAGNFFPTIKSITLDSDGNWGTPAAAP